MIFDSQQQKNRVIDLIGEAPVATNIKGILQGPAPALKELMRALHTAQVMDPEEQTTMLWIWKERKEDAAAQSDD